MVPRCLGWNLTYQLQMKWPWVSHFCVSVSSSVNGGYLPNKIAELHELLCTRHLLPRPTHSMCVVHYYETKIWFCSSKLRGLAEVFLSACVPAWWLFLSFTSIPSSSHLLKLLGSNTHISLSHLAFPHDLMFCPLAFKEVTVFVLFFLLMNAMPYSKFKTDGMYLTW